MTLRSDGDTPDHGRNDSLAGRGGVTSASKCRLQSVAFYFFQTREIGPEMGKFRSGSKPAARPWNIQTD